MSAFKARGFIWVLVILSGLIFLQAHWLFFLALFLFFLLCVLPFSRKNLTTRFLLNLIQKKGLLPKISQTEKEALLAGKVWIEREFFSGRPNIQKLSSPLKSELSQEEKDFIDNEVETLCSMIDDWKIYKTRQIPAEVDQYIREKKFLGITIPKSYGGLGFSHTAHSRILEKVCSKSYSIGIYVMVPNSLGPGELLIRYGTEKQKDKYLPRLASGKEIPCFGLTEPQAGSDAGAIESKGVLFKDEKGNLQIKLNWNKRWITLASVSTLLGVAFQLEDPDEILEKGVSLGITCALIPSTSPGVILGKRHDPMGIPFPNCPMQGRDVVVSAEDHIIGGIEKAGKGWAMLMDCLGAGRGISLPSSSLASSKLLTRIVFHHSVMRQQFGLSIGKFEGVNEVLAQMAGRTFLSQAILDYNLSVLDKHIASSLCSAISKYQLTEMARKTALDGMDIMGGAGISMGPRNLSAMSYIGAPIAITVEGANILTRSFIIFGQGLIRAHPFIYKEISAAESGNVKEFDHFFWSHAALAFQNIIRLIYLSVTRGIFIFVPGWRGKGLRAWQKISWAGCIFSNLSEMAMLILGAKLKRKEKLTGRFADALMNLYKASAVLWFWKSRDKDKRLWPFVKWSLEESFRNMQNSFEGILYNFPAFSWLFRGVFFPLLRLNSISSKNSDTLSHQMSESLFNSPQLLNDLTQGIYTSQDKKSQMNLLERCFVLSQETEVSRKKIKKAIRNGELEKKRIKAAKDQALEKGIIEEKEHQKLSELEKLRREAVQVDSFSQEEYLNP